jgi:beta-lactamase regulating signal transducer with metallopeptidase domain
MTPLDIASLADRLAAASLEGAAIVAVAWIAFRLMPAVPPAVRTFVWWLAALKFVLALLPLPAVSLPVLPAALRPDATSAPTRPVAAAPEAPPVGVVDDGPLATARRNASAGARSSAPLDHESVRAPDAPRAPVDWRWIVLAVWALVVGGHAISLRSAARDLRRLLARAVPWSEQEREAVRPLAQRLGLSDLPEIRTSSDVEVPLVAGVRHPVVLVPAGAFTAAERMLMLAHELAHVRRRDLAWGWVPAAAERLFFFHPLAHLAAREYLLAREAACDADVIRMCDIASADYGRLLVRFGVSTRVPALVAGGSSPSTSSLRRRLEMLHLMSAGRTPRSTWLIALAVAGLVPLQLGARQAPRVLEPTAANESSAPLPPQRVVAATSLAPAQRVVVHEDRSAAAIEAGVRAIEEQRRGGDVDPAPRPPNDPQRMAPTQEVVHLWQEQASLHREIERSLQELAAEFTQALANQERTEAERLRTAEAQAAATSDAHQAIRLELERAARARATAQTDRAGSVARQTRELADQLAEARARLAQLERQGRAEAHPDLLGVQREVGRLEQELTTRAPRQVAPATRAPRQVAPAARSPRQVEPATREPRQVEPAAREPREVAAIIRDEMERLRRDQEVLVEQLQLLRAQQEVLIELQQRLSDAAERLRRELEQR